MRESMPIESKTSPKADRREPSDGSLVRRFRLGSQDAAALLHGRYARRLRGLVRARISPAMARRLDDEDIVQSAFGYFFEAVGRDGYDVPVGEELWGLLMVITLYRLRTRSAFHLAAKRDVRMTVDVESLDHAARETDAGLSAMMDLTVREALGGLGESQRSVVQMRMDGYEVAEIAAKLGRSKRSVERILKECREVLGRLLEE